MFADLDDFYTKATAALPAFDAFIQKHQLGERTAPDHICYKCASHESFIHTRAILEEGSRYLHQTFISGRRIAYLRLERDVTSVLGGISFLELSDQKPDGSQKEGFDHVEVYPTMFSYEDMVAELKKKEAVLEVVRPHHTTHDVDVGGGFLFRCTREPLIEKIKREEMT